MQSLADVREHDHCEGSRSNDLQSRGESSSSNKCDPCAEEQQANWKQRKQRFQRWGIHKGTST